MIRVNEVAVIDVATNSVPGTIPVGDGPWTIAFTPDGALAYVVNAGEGSVSVIQTVDQTVVDVVPVGSSPLRAVVMPAPLPNTP